MSSRPAHCVPVAVSAHASPSNVTRPLIADVVYKFLVSSLNGLSRNSLRRARSISCVLRYKNSDEIRAQLRQTRSWRQRFAVKLHPLLCDAVSINNYVFAGVLIQAHPVRVAARLRCDAVGVITPSKASTCNPGTRYPTFIFRNRFRNEGTENRPGYIIHVDFSRFR